MPLSGSLSMRSKKLCGKIWQKISIFIRPFSCEFEQRKARRSNLIYQTAFYQSQFGKERWLDVGTYQAFPTKAHLRGIYHDPPIHAQERHPHGREWPSLALGRLGAESPIANLFLCKRIGAPPIGVNLNRRTSRKRWCAVTLRCAYNVGLMKDKAQNPVARFDSMSDPVSHLDH